MTPEPSNRVKALELTRLEREYHAAREALR